MKKIEILLACIAFCLPAFAQDNLHNVQIAYEISNYKYKEPGLMSISSKPKQGVSVLYTRRSVFSSTLSESDNSFGSLEFRYMGDRGDYDGGLQDGTKFKADNLKDYYLEATLRMGAVYSLSEEWELWPYLGFGWRQLRNHLEESGPSGYLRESTYWYMPIGVNVRYHNTAGWNFVLNGEFDYFLGGRQYSGDVLGLEANTNDQDDGYGVRVGLKAEKNFGKVGIFIEPFWRYWKIQESDVAYKRIPGTSYGIGVIEPNNNTYEYGLKAGLTF